MSFKAKFRSERDIALVTQDVSDSPLLTVENYLKWYDLYLIRPDGAVTKVTGLSKEVDIVLMDNWYDHCVSPEGFHKVAELLKADYDIATYESVCSRYRKDYLEEEC